VLHEFRLNIDGCDVPLAADSAADCSNWVLALSMMLSRSNQGGQTSSSHMICTEEDERNNSNFVHNNESEIRKLRETLEHVKNENMRLRQQLDEESHQNKTNSVACKATDELHDFNAQELQDENKELKMELMRMKCALEAITAQQTIVAPAAEAAICDDSLSATNVSTIKSIINTKTTEILEAIWSANTTSEKTSDVTKAPVADLETAIMELTESLEMRTSRIGKMVHELLQRPDPESTFKKVLEENGLQESDGGKISVEEIKQALNAISEKLKDLRPSGGASENEATTSNTMPYLGTDSQSEILMKIHEGQKTLGVDLDTMMGMMAASGVAQRARDSEIITQNISKHEELRKLLTESKDAMALSGVNITNDISNKLEKLQIAFDASLRGIQTSLRETFELGNVQAHDRSITSTIMAAVSEIQQHLAPSHSRSTSITASSTADDLINAKLDNVCIVRLE
jgi:ribosomal protein L29